MKIGYLIIVIGILSSCAPKTMVPTATAPIGKDTSIVGRTDTITKEEYVPDCILKMIDKFSADAVQNPPRKIVRYIYKGNFVYYVPPVCCDQYSELYDSTCLLLGHPDGGITGRGDGKLPDFARDKTKEKLVWEDKRK